MSSARKRMNLIYVLALYSSTHIIAGFVQSPNSINVVPLVDEPCNFPHVLPVQFKNEILENVKLFTKSTLFTNIPVYIEKRDVHSSNQSSIHLQDFSHQKIMSYRDVDDNSALIIECLKVDFVETELWNGIIKLDGVFYHLEPKAHPGSDMKYRLNQITEQTLPKVNTKYLRFKPLYRKKRMVKSTYQIEILVVVDYQIFQRFYRQSSKSSDKTKDAKNNIRKYFALLVHSINIIYGDIKSNKLNVQINLVGIIISQTSQDSPWTVLTPSGLLSTDKLLEEFHKWITKHNLPTNDHAMLFTGYNLASVSYENIAGRAVLGAMCKYGKESVSVVVDKGGLQSVTTACHELGHSLGMNHDDKVTGCLSSDQFIMTAKTTSVNNQNKFNKWLFSHCSVTEMETHIESIMATGTSSEKTCLLKKLPNGDEVPDVISLQPGQIYDPDEQCRQIYGINSYYCRDVTISGDPADVCTTMFCFIPKTLKCVGNIYHAARGSSCGNKKWCINGQCVSSDLAPVKPNSCVFGDQPQQLLLIQGQTTAQSRTCSAWISTHRQLCYQPSFKSICCSSCSAHKTENTGCEYGDKVTGCLKARCNEIYPDGVVYDAKCCGTCNLQTPFTCSHENGAICDKEIKQSGSGLCYNYKFAFKCCKSCQKFRKSEQKNCEYGNRDTDERCKIHTQGGTKNCDVYVSQCCQSCLIKSTSTNTAAPIYHSIFNIIHVSVIIVFVVHLYTGFCCR